MKLLFFLIFLSPLAYSIESKDLLQSISKQEAVLIDMREKEEVEQGMIKQAQWIPLSKTSPRSLTKLKKNLGKKLIYVYCRSGARAEQFITKLKPYGMRAVNLGGFEKLKLTGLPLNK